MPAYRTRFTIGACLALIFASPLHAGSPAGRAPANGPACDLAGSSVSPSLRKRVDAIDRQLGIPAGYARNHHLVMLPEATELAEVPRDVYGRKVEMATPAAAALKAMIAAAARDGVKLETVSGFRSIAYQEHLVRGKLDHGMTIGQALAINAVPGYSEHQTGCAIDLTTPGVPAADAGFAKSKAYAWLRGHAAAFGFRLSYPPGNVQGYEFEPWHWRFTGRAAAGAGSGSSRRAGR
jgi:zinc D-Ala-D-Ala carboxypeptidase